MSSSLLLSFLIYWRKFYTDTQRRNSKLVRNETKPNQTKSKVTETRIVRCVTDVDSNMKVPITKGERDLTPSQT